MVWVESMAGLVSAARYILNREDSSRDLLAANGVGELQSRWQMVCLPSSFDFFLGGLLHAMKA